MRVLVYSSTAYTERMFAAAVERRSTAGSNATGPLEFKYCESRLNITTAVLASGYHAICCFVDDDLDKSVLTRLKALGVEFITLRSTGFNHVDLSAAAELSIKVSRVSSYSPYAVAEFAVALLLSMVRKIHRSYNRVQEGNFLLDGLLGFDLHGKTVGVIGLGKIGGAFADIMNGFGCKVVAHDPYIQAQNIEGRDNVVMVEMDELLKRADIISLHLPLTPDSFHMINSHTLAQMKPKSVLINTSRGALVHAGDLINTLKQGRLSGVCLDVYEEESDLFYCDLQDKIINDDEFVRLRSFPNVLITGHQGFFTEEALMQISDVTIQNLLDFRNGLENDNSLNTDTHVCLVSKPKADKHYRGTRYIVREKFIDGPDV